MPLIEDKSSHQVANMHWKSLLHDFKPCYFPGLLDGSPASKELFHETTIELDVNNQLVENFCYQQQVTSQILFQTAWAIVINRYAGVEDVSFGTFSDDGTSSDSTFICRTHVTAENSLRQTMMDTQRDFDKILAHQECSLAEIQQDLGLEDQPLFNSSLQLRRKGRKYRDLKEYDIVARISVDDDAPLSASIRTRTSKFSEERTAEVAHTLGKTLLEILKASPKWVIGDLDIFSQRDYDKVMGWNKPIHSSVDNTFHQLFEDIVRKMPDAPAICSWDGNFTYHELDAISTKLASHLANLGVVPEMSILLCFDKSAFAIISMLGIMKAGGAFVAIDPSYPASRIEAILQATDASIVVAEPAHCHLFEGNMKHVITIDPESAQELPLKPEGAISQSSPSNTAYIVFTSGSTGAPKGIMVEHRALCTAALALATPMGINSSTRHLNFAAFTFDLSYGDIFVTLSQGACLCLPSEYERVNELAGAIVRMNVNSACLVPSVVRIFQPEDVPCLKTLSLGGEALLKENLELWAPRVSLTNMYGPSECTIWCCSNTNLRADSAANNIGRGVGALLWIASPYNHNHLCPIGCIGELLIEGPVMARGYVNAEQTKEAFVENPSWAEVDSGQRRRFYKTGDLVKYNPDGSVSFIGRKDTQVKFHGRRIEMGEIEYHLASHDSLKQSVMILPSNGVYSQKLVAVVVLKKHKASSGPATELRAVTGSSKEESMLEVAKIKEFLSSRVPYYMLPQFWVVVEDIPLMISGKMNRVLTKKFVEELTEQSCEEGIDRAANHMDLDDAVETQLREIWSLVLNRNIDDIGVEQSFESLGGDSFSAMELVARCKAEDLAVTVPDFLDNTTIRQLASMIKMRLSGTMANGNGSHEASRAQVHSSLHSTLKLPPAWWDSRPAVASSRLRIDLP